MSQTWYKVAENLYKQQQAQGQQPEQKDGDTDKPSDQSDKGPIDTDIS